MQGFESSFQFAGHFTRAWAIHMLLNEYDLAMMRYQRYRTFRTLHFGSCAPLGARWWPDYGFWNVAHLNHPFICQVKKKLAR